MLRIRTLWILFASMSLGEFLLSGLSIWAPTFFRRYHGFSAAGGGGIVALLALSMVGGVVLGARLGDRYLSEGRARSRIRLAAWSNIALAAFLVPAFWLGPLYLAAPLFISAGFCLGLPMAPLSAVGLDILVPHLRGRAQSVRSLMRVGATALAPLLFGYLSDVFSLRAAFVIVAPVTAVSGLVLFLAARTYEDDMATAQEEAHRQFVLEEADPSSDDVLVPLPAV
jgi:MFS family permease